MEIRISNGNFTKDTEAMAFLRGSEEEYLAALAQKLETRKAQKARKEAERAEKERLKKEREAKAFSDLLDRC